MCSRAGNSFEEELFPFSRKSSWSLSIVSVGSHLGGRVKEKELLLKGLSVKESTDKRKTDGSL